MFIRKASIAPSATPITDTSNSTNAYKYVILAIAGLAIGYVPMRPLLESLKATVRLDRSYSEKNRLYKEVERNGTPYVTASDTVRNMQGASDLVKKSVSKDLGFIRRVIFNKSYDMLTDEEANALNAN